MNNEVKELVERVRLTDEEIQDIWDTSGGWISWVQYGRAVAKAQLSSYFNDPDLYSEQKTKPKIKLPENPYNIDSRYEDAQFRGLGFDEALQQVKEALEKEGVKVAE